MQMVNVGFPEPIRYGFEKVDVSTLVVASMPAINRKFTPNQVIRTFGEVSAN
jgi:hypothetical protein